MSQTVGPPIFIVGSSRSGTTLLYSILLSSGEFPLFEAETHLLDLCPVIYGDIRRKRNYERFLADWLASKPFRRSGLDRHRFRAETGDAWDHYVDFLKHFLDSVARSQAKTRWVEQTPGHVYFADIICERFPGVKFIHVIRDGRDVALSRRRTGWSGTGSRDPRKQLISAAVSWEASVKQGKKIGERLGSDYLEVRYEDIVLQLASVLEKLRSFAGIEIGEASLAASNVGSLRSGNTAYEEKMAGISGKGVYRWKTLLSPEDVRLLNWILGRTLRELGYEIDQAPCTKPVDVELRYRLYACRSRALFWPKRWLKHHTPLGCLSRDRIPMSRDDQDCASTKVEKDRV